MTFRNDWNDFCDWCVKHAKGRVNDFGNQVHQQWNQYLDEYEAEKTALAEEQSRIEEEVKEALEQYRVWAGIKGYNGETRILLKGVVDDRVDEAGYIDFYLYDIPMPFDPDEPWDFKVGYPDRIERASIDVVDESSVSDERYPSWHAAVEVEYDPYSALNNFDPFGEITRVFFFEDDVDGAFEYMFEQAIEVYTRNDSGGFESMYEGLKVY